MIIAISVFGIIALFCMGVAQGMMAVGAVCIMLWAFGVFG